ncbi:hypothetical protein Tco_0568890 [Tanacetum coccineum]
MIEEEEHLALADSTVVALPAADQAPSAEETKPISIQGIPVPTAMYGLMQEVARLLAIIYPTMHHYSPHVFTTSPDNHSSVQPTYHHPHLCYTRTTSYPHSFIGPIGCDDPVPHQFLLHHHRCYAYPLRIVIGRTDPGVTLPPSKEVSIALGPGYRRLGGWGERPLSLKGQNYGFVATMDGEIRHDPERRGWIWDHRLMGKIVDDPGKGVRDTKRRMMVALEVVNLRVSYQVDVRSRESSEFYSRHHDTQKDRAVVRAEIEVLRRERLAYEQESMENRQALAKSVAYSRALEA